MKMPNHERFRWRLRITRWSESLQVATLGFVTRAQRFHRHIVLVWRSFRTSSGRDRLRNSLYRRVPRLTQHLAGLHRRTLARKAHLVAVVGSFGKTTATRAIKAALGIDDTRLLFGNTRTGLSASLLRIRPFARHAVLEVGIDRKGMMESYAQHLRPDIAVVTCIGSEHMTSLGSLETTRAEKAKMVAAIPSSGLVVLNGDDANVLWMRDQSRARVVTYGFGELNDVRATDVVDDDLSGVRFNLQIDGQTYAIRTRLIGRHMIYPILAAMTVAYEEGVDLSQCIASLERLAPTHNRLQPIQLPDSGAWILMDAYKSALETIDAALDTMSRLSASRKIVVLGDVEEPPGSQGPIYKALGSRLAEVADYVIFVGGKTNFSRLKVGTIQGGLSRDAMTNTRTDPHEIAQALNKIGLSQGDLVLIKGRSTQHLERVVLILTSHDVACNARFCARRHDCETCPLLQHPA